MSERKDLVVWTPTAKHRFDVEAGTSVQDAYDNLPEDMRRLPLTAFHRGVPIEPGMWRSTFMYPGDHITFGMVPQGGGKNKGILGMVVGIVAVVAGSITGQPWAVQLGAGLILSGAASMLIKPPSLNSNMQDSSVDSSYYGVTGQSNEATPYQVVPKLYGAHKIYPVIAAQPIIRNSGQVSRISTLYDFGVGMYNIGNLRIGETPADTFAPSFAFHWNTKTPALQYVTNKVQADQLAYVLQQNQPLVLQTDDNAAYVEIDLAFARGFTYYNDSGSPQNTSVNFRVQYRAVGSSQWIGVGPDKVSGISASFLNGESNTSGPVDFIDPQGYVTIQGKTGNEVYHWRGTYNSTDATPPDGTNGLTGITLSRSGSYNSALGGYPLRVRGTQINGGVTGFRLTAASVKPIVAAILIGPLPGGQYEVSITRLDPISTSTRRVDEATITQNKSFIYGNVLNLKSPHTMVEMSLIGSEKLSGVVQNLSADAVSVLPWYDIWGNQTNFEATRNPAWICLDILMGPCNPRPVSPAQIDFPAWVALANYCDQQRTWTMKNGVTVTDTRFMCDIVVDYRTTVQEMVDSVLATCHATRTVNYAGKWGVTIDEKDFFTPRQLITPANSWGFTGRRTYPEDVHAFRVSFVDSTNEYQKQEVLCYRDGYDENNATKFESLGTFGISTWYHAWAYGRYMFAQAIARQEVFTVTMDIENLAVTRGEGVLVQHDVPIIGGYPCRVIAGGNNPIPTILRGTLGDPVPGQTAQGYPIKVSAEFSSMPHAYTVRMRDGSIRTGQVVGMVDSDILILENGLGINPDDLIVLGEVDRTTEAYIVLSISPGKDMSATLTLVRYDPDMYDSDISPLPVWDPTWGSDVTNSTNLAVSHIEYQTSVSYEDRRPVQTWLITFGVNTPALFGWAEAWLVLKGYPDRYLGRINGYSLQFTESILGTVIAAQGGATVRIEPFTGGGLQGKPGSIFVPVTPDRTKPNPVKNFAVNVQSETIVMFWDLQSDPDTWKHEIRYHPDPVNGVWELAQLVGQYDWWVTTANAGARTGKYFIRTVDTSGNWSDILWQRTTVEVLPDIDLVEEVYEVGFPGILQDMHFNADGKPQLDGDFGAVAPLGYYFYAQTVDLGSIYEVRIVSKILGHALSSYSYMAAWVPLSNQSPLASGYTGYWNVTLEVRGSNTPTVMADWVPMASADPIGGSREDAWTPWRSIQVGDITARFIQFRIRVDSLDPFISAVIDDAHVTVDVKERRWFLNDQNVPAAGAHFNYDPAFMETPTIAISTNGGTATRYEITNKTRIGFDIQLFNGSTAVAGNIDIAVIGWGKEKVAVI